MSLHISRIDPLLNAFMPTSRFVGNTPQDHADLIIRYGINLERRWRMAVEAMWDQAARDAPERDNTAADMSECS